MGDIVQTALVTGATSGIGKAIALELALAGYKVFAIGRNREALDWLAKQPKIEAMEVDIADTGSLASAIKGIDPDVLINNAGIMPRPGRFQDSDETAIDLSINVNLTAQLKLTRLVLPEMIARGYGHIFFTGSVAGHSTYPNMAVYSATKAAIGVFAQALRQEVYHHGVRVTEIVAGRVQTDLYQGVVSKIEREKMYKDGTAVQPSDVAQMVHNILNMPKNADVVRFDILPGTSSRPED